MYRKTLSVINFPTWVWYRMFQRGMCYPKLEQSSSLLVTKVCVAWAPGTKFLEVLDGSSAAGWPGTGG